MNRFFIPFFLFVSYAVLAEEPLGTPDIDYIEYPDDEQHTSEEIELGKVLFFDTRLSANQKQSCATCHNPDLGFGDGFTKGFGTMGNRLGRNTPHLYNLAWNATFFWDGRAESLEEQAIGPIESKDEMNIKIEELIPRLQAVPYYLNKFHEVYGEKGITKENIGRALAAFERQIIVSDTPFDQYISGNKNAMSPSAIRGLDLFKGKANCIACHDGPNFTDNSYHNIGLKDKDEGRIKIDSTSDLISAFKTPGLRNVIFTAPYMHDGSEPTLETVIRFYNRGGDVESGKSNLIKPLDLTEGEIYDLVAFLGALTDQIEIERPEIK